MKKIIALTVLALCFSLPAAANQPVAAAAPVKTEAAPASATTSPALSAQADKMKTCAAEYKSMGIDKAEYRRFMSICLKKDYTPGSYKPGVEAGLPAAKNLARKPGSRNVKVETCNAEAKSKSLKGAALMSFMKSCLAAAPTAVPAATP